MDNAQKAIMIGVGLFITIIIIAAVMLITGMGQDLLNSGTKKLSNVSAQLQAELTSNYDYQVLTGSQVLSAVKQYYNDPEVIIGLNNNKTSATADDLWMTTKTINPKRTASFGSNITKLILNTSATVVANTAQPTLGELTSTSSSSKMRIVTTGQYRSYLIDLNGSVLGIFFQRI